ncbi:MULTISPECIES: hypothetical protein [unclassified Pantoea]|uniref:hypothetical protein n=1 Tax=unclassified Pantoea TaxID=2630326 RepID=UPI001E31149E|nr:MULTISPECIES: hypothetical protein [unclassified Pantoea]
MTNPEEVKERLPYKKVCAVVARLITKRGDFWRKGADLLRFNNHLAQSSFIFFRLM